MNNKFKKVRVLPFDKEKLSHIRDEQVVVTTDSLINIEDQYRESLHDKEVLAMVVSLPFASLSGISWNSRWEAIPLIILAYNVGDYDTILRVLPLIRRMNVRLYLSDASDTFQTDLKFLSSIGIDCGLFLEEGTSISEDVFLDLASYYYLSKGRHASIEPFEFILRHLNDDKNVSFDAVYFKDPILFRTSDEQDANDFAEKVESYYSHFMNLNECAMCPAFKICNHKMKEIFADCSSVMAEVFDMAEIRHQINNKEHNPKSVCQL